jgi:hypothetical protein
MAKSESDFDGIASLYLYQELFRIDSGMSRGKQIESCTQMVAFLGYNRDNNF